MRAEDIAAKFGGGKRPVGKVNGADVWTCRCPIHGGESNNSLHLWDGDGGSLGARCHAGCSYQTVLDAVGVEFTYEGRRHSYGNGKRDPEEPLHVYRRRGRDKDLSGNHGSNRGLLVKLAEDDEPENYAVLAEGEKAYDAVTFNAPDGFTAAHWVGGSGSVEHADYSPLEGRKVILWPDAGQQGHDVMAKAAVRLHSLPAGVAQLWIVDTSGLPDKADAADVSADTMAKMLAAVSLYEPPPPVDAEDAEAVDQGAGFARHSLGLRAVFNHLLLETRVNIRGGGIEVRRRDHGTPEAVALITAAGIETDPMGWGALSSTAEAHLRDLMQRTFRDTNGKPYRLGEDMWREKILSMTAAERTDPIQHWLEKLPPWDRTERIPTLFKSALGAADTPLNRATATAFMVGAVRRTYEPGCQHDWAPVLIGSQGSGKTTFVAELVPLDYASWRGRVRNLADDTQKQVESVNNAWIIEFPEMRGTHRLEQIKTYMDEPVESFRPPYARISERWPRRWVGIGTANDTGAGVLPDDPSGNRRYVAVVVDPPGATQEERSAYVRAYLAENRDQLWAEALHRYRGAEKSYLAGEFEQERDAVNTQYTRANQPLEDIAANLTEQHADGPPVALSALMVESKLAEDAADASDKVRTVGRNLAGELVKRDWYKQRRMRDGKQQTLWYPPVRVQTCAALLRDGATCGQPLNAGECDVADTHGDNPPPGAAAGGDSGAQRGSAGMPPSAAYIMLDAIEARLAELKVPGWPEQPGGGPYQPIGDRRPYALAGALIGMRNALAENPALMSRSVLDSYGGATRILAWVEHEMPTNTDGKGYGGTNGEFQRRYERLDWAASFADLRLRVAKAEADKRQWAAGVWAGLRAGEMA